jgi:hypothetical protein
MTSDEKNLKNDVGNIQIVNQQKRKRIMACFVLGSHHLKVPYFMTLFQHFKEI